VIGPTRPRGVVLATALLAYGCPSQETAPAPAQADNAKTRSVAAAPVADEELARTVEIDNAFVPDPRVVVGRSGGPLDASTLDAACTGWVDPEPDHVLVTRGAFADLRILALCDEHVTLVLRGPDGQHRCGDSATVGILLAGPFLPGRHEIWVGSLQREGGADYRLGFSELDRVTATMLADGPR